jgi:thiol:disulfide interchange protein
VTRLALAALALAVAAGGAGATPAKPAKPAKSAKAKPANPGVAWRSDERAAFAEAAAADKGVLVDVTATWCAACAELEHTLAPHAAELEAAFVPLRLDVSEDSDANFARLERYAARTLPALVFVTARGDVLGRVSQAVDDEALATTLHAAITALRAAKPARR